MWEPVSVEGITLPPHPYEVPWDKYFADIRALTLREDDVIVCAYMKAGTHWMWEVIQMLKNNSVSYDKRTKENVMIEFSTVERLDAAPSPRVLNTHLHFRMLPVANIKEKKLKLVHVYRNPKDSAVSMWYHIRQFIPDMALSPFIKQFTKGPCVFNTQVEYLRQMEQFMNDNPDVAIFNMSFEEAKRRPTETVKRLAQFLGVEASDQLCEDIAEACSFKKMKEVDKAKTKPEGTAWEVALDFYRKGEVGDWKNHLSAEDNEVLDLYIAEGLQGLTKFHMEYTAPEREIGDCKNHLSAEQNIALEQLSSEVLQGLNKFHMEYTAPESQ